jgi:hypothetical protein
MGAAVEESQATNGRTVGLECPRCGCRHFKVIETVPKTHYIYRRRRCMNPFCRWVCSSTERIIGEARPPHGHI